MIDQNLQQRLQEELTELQKKSLYKEEGVLSSPQGAKIRLADGREVLNFCANNYLGLSNHPVVIEAAKVALDRWGYGMSSVRFICGTQQVHLDLEAALSRFLGTEATLLYSSCFDANGGLFETLFGPEDALISDALNHASIIDGIRLCKAQRLRYAHNDMEELEARLREAQGARSRLIVTDGVFSMDGRIANLPAICDLAERYRALVLVDDSHAVGVIGRGGSGTHDACGVRDRVDLLTGTFGKALGGASGGYISGRREMIDWLRQRSRPYLFSNSLAPVIAATTLAVLELLEQHEELVTSLQQKARYFRQEIEALGFTLLGKDHPIIPILLGEAALAKAFAARMMERGIYVVSFSYPVVPEGAARIRVQISAAHTQEDLDAAVSAFREVGRELLFKGDV